MNRRNFLAAIGLGLTSCKCELEDMDITKKHWWMDGESSTPSFNFPPTETPSDLVLDFNTARLKTMFGGSLLSTAVAANGDNIGLMYDISYNAMVANWYSSLCSASLLSDATVNSFINFNGTTPLIVRGSKRFFKNMHSASPLYTVAVKVNFTGTTNATLFCIYDNSGLSGSNRGFGLFRNASNKIVVSGYNGATIYTATSVNNYTNANTWYNVFVSVNGAGTNTGRLLITSITGTVLEDIAFNVTAGGDFDSTFDFVFGGNASGTAGYLGYLAHLKVWKVALTSQMITDYVAFNPARSSDDFKVISDNYDFNDTAYIFSNTTQSTSVTNNVAARVIRSKKISSFGDNYRYAQSAASGSSPVWKSSQINSLGVLEFDGTDDNMTFQNQFMADAGGCFAVFFVAKNNDASFGSHILGGSSAVGHYFVLTGSGYSGDPGNTNPYAVWHPGSSGVNIPVDINMKGAGVDDFKVWGFRRNGLEISAFNGLKEKSTNTTNALSVMSWMGDQGQSALSQWKLNGQVAYIIKVNGYMSDADMEEAIDYFNYTYGL